MAKYPHVQKRAQEEIDRVVGPGRLPTFDDMDTLPYVGCLLQETIRCVNYECACKERAD